MSVFVKHAATPCVFTSSESWVILSPIEQSIKRKIEAVGTPLKDWGIQINYGIKTGCNEAFIIDEAKRAEILSWCHDANERKRTEQIIRPILRGRDVKRYAYNWAGLYLLWVPWHFPLHLDESIIGASAKAEMEFMEENWHYSDFDKAYYEDKRDLTTYLHWDWNVVNYVEKTISKQSLDRNSAQFILYGGVYYDRVNPMTGLPYYIEETEEALAA